MKDEIYLGDGVYAGHDGYHIWLWTSDGIDKSKPIALEPQVLDALNGYRSTLMERARVARTLDALNGYRSTLMERARVARTLAREDSEDADAEANR